jgi:F0F1-type ATP synthase epsilon subunit
MLHFKSIGTPLVLVLALFAISGCEQAEKSAQQVLNQAAQSAKEAIDKTNEAAQQALSEATGSQAEKKPSDTERDDSAQDI